MTSQNIIIIKNRNTHNYGCSLEQNWQNVVLHARKKENERKPKQHYREVNSINHFVNKCVLSQY